MPTRVIPEAWLPATDSVKRVIVHWTAGGYNPSVLDRAHYHVLINGRGEAVRGLWPIGRYNPPSHVRMLNTGSVGLAICAMAGAQNAHVLGPAPVTRLQWERACQAAAEILYAYGLEVSERTLLCHSEVERVYGQEQRGKWDVDVTPWDPGKPRGEIHAEMRRKAEWYLARRMSTSAMHPGSL
ncbi:MAG TPA: N-acetylmuramoyl-L-alanine amidase [Armatimonadota bacterium]|nr:N-acetylmuramoyl-L-alanine amidase [Armatimonadota bacterium]